MVVTICLDPENNEGSTQRTLGELEWEGGYLLL
jgi:hypothetical protein